MKKLFTFISAALFAVSMSATTFTFSAQSDTTMVKDLDALEIEYYPDYSKEGAYDYTFLLYNSKDTVNSLPMVSFDILTKQEKVYTGTYSVKDGTLTEYSYYMYGAGDKDYIEFTDGEVTITDNGKDNYTIKGWFTDGNKVYGVNVTLDGKVSADTIEVACTTAKITDATDGDGWFQIIAESSNYAGVYICVNSTSLAGTYTSTDIDYNYTALYDSQQTTIDITSASGNVTVSSDTTYFDFNLSDASGNIYHAYGYILSRYLREPDQNWNADFTNGEYDDQYASYGVILITGNNTTNSASIRLHFNGESIPTAGSYGFSTDGTENTFMSGYFEKSYLYGSNIATNDYSQIWYLVSGTITVETNGNITLNAVNSKGKAITGTIIMGGATSFDNVNGDAKRKCKYIDNNQLYILRDGKTYNAHGALVK